MNKFGSFVFLIVLLLCIGNVYSIDHSLGSDLEIKQSVVDKMKKEKFTYSYKEIKNKKRNVRKYSTAKDKVIFVLNKIEKGGEFIKTTIETTLDNLDMKKILIFGLVGLFIVWYVRRVIKNSFLNEKKVNIYFKESGNYDKKYHDLSYPYYDSTSYLSNHNNTSANQTAQTEESRKFSMRTSRFFSQHKRKNSDDNNPNLFNYAYV